MWVILNQRVTTFLQINRVELFTVPASRRGRGAILTSKAFASDAKEIVV